MSDEKSVFEKFVSDVGGYLKERSSSDFFGPFTFFLIVSNFRLLIVLIGDGGFEDKIMFIDRAIFDDGWAVFHSFLLVPFALTVSYLLFSTPLNLAASWVRIWMRNFHDRCIYRWREIPVLSREEQEAHWAEIRSANNSMFQENIRLREYEVRYRSLMKSAGLQLRSFAEMFVVIDQAILDSQVDFVRGFEFPAFYDGSVPDRIVSIVQRRGIPSKWIKILYSRSASDVDVVPPVPGDPFQSDAPREEAFMWMLFYLLGAASLSRNSDRFALQVDAGLAARLNRFLESGGRE